MLGCHALQGIRHVIALVDDLLQKFVKLLPVDIGNRVDLAGPELNPQARQTGVETVVSFSLDPTNLSQSAKMVLCSRVMASRSGMTS